MLSQLSKMAAIAALVLSLGACAPGAGITPASLTSAEDAVIADAIAICGFEPTIATVGGLIANAVVPGSAALTSLVTGLGDAICKAELPAKPLASGMRKLGAPVVLYGVTINGHFVK
jgi:hypothetical protein